MSAVRGRSSASARASSRALVLLGVLAAIASATPVACSRTGIDELADSPDASVAPDGGPLFEGGALDADASCGTRPYCEPSDPGYIYKCGVRVFQCSSLEKCKNAACVNPCRDTLGEDTSNGCEFYAVEMDLVKEAQGACYAVFVVNQWGTGEPARLEVDRGGPPLPIERFARIPVGFGPGLTYAPYDAQKGLAKDQVAILFLSREEAAVRDPNPIAPRRLASCPPGVTPAVVGDAAIHGTGRGRAFHVKSNVPVVAYQMLPYGGGRARVTGATLLLPTNVWGNNYVAANAYDVPQSSTLLPTLAILGQAERTRVTIKPVTTIFGEGGLAGTRSGVPITYSLARGEYLQFTQGVELTGSAIQADAPIAVVGGNTGTVIPVTRRQRADGSEQMLPPIRALGSEYVGVRYRSRDRFSEESVPWRIVGVAPGTRLEFDPPSPFAPNRVAPGQIVEFNAPGPFIVRSQDAEHPFYFAQYMTGGEPYDGEGDPDFVNVVPPRQYLPRYTFFTDPTYPETNLVVVRVRDPATGAMPDVDLDCAGRLGGWRPVGAPRRRSAYEFTRIDLSTGDFRGQNGCNNGVHVIEARAPATAPKMSPLIGVTVWGWGNPITHFGRDEDHPKFTRWVSYGYPAGANLKALNSVVFPAR